MTNTDTKEIKHCVDCDHFYGDGSLGRCRVTPSVDMSSEYADWLVTGDGDSPESYSFASIARSMGKCGPRAKLFTPRTTKQMPAIEAESSAA